MPELSAAANNIYGMRFAIQNKFRRKYNETGADSRNRTSAELGRRGEQAALDFLKNNGYKIIETDFRTRAGQIDIIARDKDTICFVEVKTRRTTRLGHPYEAVENSKQYRISKAALMYLKQKKLINSPARFDAVSVLYSDKQPKIELIKNAFQLNCRYLY